MSKQKVEDLPSWVPDWSAAPKTASLYITTPHRAPKIAARNIFHACGNYVHRSVSYSPRLFVQGKTIDTIRWISAHHSIGTEAPINDIRHLPNLDAILSQIHHTFPGKAELYTPERLLSVLIAEGGNAGGGEPIFQQEAMRGLPEWRIRELIETYRRIPMDSHPITNIYKPEEYEEQLDMRALTAYGRVAWNRKVIVTGKGSLGLAPRDAKEGDCVCILHGSVTPVVLRRCEEGWTVVGQCYVEGVMRGEAVSWKEDEGDQFVLM